MIFLFKLRAKSVFNLYKQFQKVKVILNYIYNNTIVCIGHTPQMYIITCLLQTKKGNKIPLYADIVLSLVPTVISC